MVCSVCLIVCHYDESSSRNEDRAPMKRRFFPVRGDHELLTPDTHTQSGVHLSSVNKVKLEHGISQSVHLNDLYCSKRASGTATQRLAASLGRRLRFEDETEMDVESRYQERQRRQMGTHRTGLLVSKLDMNLYINGRAGVGPQVDNQCHTCGTYRSNISQQPSVAADREQISYRTHVNLWTEPIRETYIGYVTQVETGGGGAKCPSHMQVRRRTNMGTHDQKMMTCITDLPINPYSSDQLNTSRCPSASLPPMMSSITSVAVMLNDTKGQNVNQKQELGRPAATQFQCVLKDRADMPERISYMDLQRRNCISSYLPAKKMMSQLNADSAAESQTPSTSRSRSGGQGKQPISAEFHSDVHLLPEQYRDCRLSRTESGSLDQLTLNPRPPANGKTSSLLKKSSSAQSLSMVKKISV